MIQTGLRISEDFDKKIDAIAKACDMSKNTAIKMLIGIGLKAFESVNFQCESKYNLLKLIASNKRTKTIEELVANSEWKSFSQIPTKLRKLIFQRDKYICQYCGIIDAPMTVDHIIPQSQGGGDEPENLITCCKVCNSKKGGKTPDQAGMQLLKGLC